jgi:hypothetical protein
MRIFYYRTTKKGRESLFQEDKHLVATNYMFLARDVQVCL